MTFVNFSSQRKFNSPSLVIIEFSLIVDEWTLIKCKPI